MTDLYARPAVKAPGAQRLCAQLSSFLPRSFRSFRSFRYYGYTAAEYYSPVRNRGTLLCYSRHQAHDNPYKNAGEQDISAHVNFSAVKKWGEEYGFEPVGFSSQGTFLVSLRIDEVLQERYAAEESSASGRNTVSQLISPAGLGESHRILIQYKGMKKHKLGGFSLPNRLTTL